MASGHGSWTRYPMATASHGAETPKPRPARKRARQGKAGGHRRSPTHPRDITRGAAGGSAARAPLPRATEVGAPAISGWA
eukprot:15156780-Alexandrium_andersonii.AAC.1